MERWPEFSSQHPRSSLQLSVTPDPEDRKPSHGHTWRQNTKAWDDDGGCGSDDDDDNN